MALDNGEGAGDYLGSDYWMARAKEGALVVFRIVKVEEPTSLREDMPGKAEPVVADVLILNGSEADTVYRSERIIQKGITNTLRSKSAPNGRGKVPRQSGDDVAVRMGTYKSFGSEKAGANPCGPDEFEKVKKVFTDTNGDPYTWYEKRAMAAVESGESGADDSDDLPF